jgi:hypothetical protein
MKKFRTMAEWVTWCTDHPEWLASVSPGGAASRLGISRQAIMQAINENRIEAARLTETNVIVGWMIPEFAIRGYAARYGHTCKGAGKRVA